MIVTCASKIVRGVAVLSKGLYKGAFVTNITMITVCKVVSQTGGPGPCAALGYNPTTIVILRISVDYPPNSRC